MIISDTTLYTFLAVKSGRLLTLTAYKYKMIATPGSLVGEINARKMQSILLMFSLLSQFFYFQFQLYHTDIATIIFMYAMDRSANFL